MHTSRVCAYIHKDAIIHNFNNIKRCFGSDTKIMPVIKADGYGHGSLIMAQTLEKKADYFAVAIMEEALYLRENGIKLPIMLLGFTFSEYFEEAVENDITLSVLTFEDASKLSSVAKKYGKTAKVHIPIDTGMSRIGFFPDEGGAEVIKRIASLDNISVEGVFTHFATSDEENVEFTLLQAERFEKIKKLLSNLNIPIYHCANSGAIMQHRNFAHNMVRPGIILYGLRPSDVLPQEMLDLKPVMELVSKVAFVKKIKKGDTISYGRTFEADREMTIATIPVGYADGYPRLLSNKGRVIINGQYAPIVGRICMDQFMVDISEIKDVSAGDRVTLIGCQGDASVTAEEVARHAQTINYEVVCGISKRVPREVIE